MDERFQLLHVDLEHIPLEQVFENLKCSRDGLTTDAAQQRLALFGPNKVEEKKESQFLKFWGFMWNPLSWVMEAAAIMAITLPNTGGKSRDWQDFVGIIAVLSINSILSIWEECDPDRVAAELMDCQVPKARVLRDGIWSEQDATLLVLGDIVRIKLGDIIPVDARILDGDSLKIDEFALMRESPTLTKGCGDCVYSGSTCKQEECEVVVIATGAHSLFAKAVAEPTNQVCHFQEVLRVIGNFCICSIAVGMFVEIIVMYIIQHRQYRSGIDNLIVLLIGGVPFTMPTVLSGTMAFGLKRLAQKGALTKRITVIEQMTSMDILCVDITGSGTLTLNTIDENLIETFAEGVEADTVVLMAAQASRTENQDPIGAAIIGMLFDPKEARAGIQEFDFLHFDPTDKSTMLICTDKKAGIKIAVADATEAARSASNIVLTEPCIRAIISVVLTSRAIIQTMKNYTIYAVSNTICIVLGFMLLALIWKFDFPPFMVLIFVILHEFTIMCISRDDRVKLSLMPHTWKLVEIFATEIVLGSYLAMTTVIFFWAVYETDFFPRVFGVSHLDRQSVGDSQSRREFITRQLASATFLQVSSISHALIFVTRSQSWSWVECPSLNLVFAFVYTQSHATLIAVYTHWSFVAMQGLGWRWAGVIWLYNIICYIPLDFIKIFMRNVLNGRTRDIVNEQRVGLEAEAKLNSLEHIV